MSEDKTDRRRIIITPPSKEHQLGELFVFETYAEYKKKLEEVFGKKSPVDNKEAKH